MEPAPGPCYTTFCPIAPAHRRLNDTNRQPTSSMALSITTGRSSRSRQHQQNESLHDAHEQRVLITVPHHPLYGQSLKVLRRILPVDGEPQLVVKLPNGHTQLIAARWTETAPTALHSEMGEVIMFSSSSLRSLVIMVASLTHQKQPEACDEPNCARRSMDDLQTGAATSTDSSVDRSPVPPTASPAVAPNGRRKR